MTRTVFLFSVVFLLLPFHAFSADPGQIVSNLQQTYRTAESWRAEFVQSTFVELLGRNIDKQGEIIVKKPGKLRIDYKDKPGRQYLSDGKTLWVYVPGDTQVEVYRKISRLLAKEALTFMEGLGDIEKEFTVRLYPSPHTGEAMIQGKNLDLIELRPRNAASIIKNIVMGIDPKTHLVVETTIFNESGNVTHYIFKNIKLNADPADELFIFKKQKGVREIKG
ncbi:MAG: outer membrane lipoprotein carrier protein LolA [Deltaproteobacteria bacterium]|nr:outer membrane lipoprotein carrier protein LolA [Deltaproteobacteria bacterium]